MLPLPFPPPLRQQKLRTREEIRRECWKVVTHGLVQAFGWVWKRPRTGQRILNPDMVLDKTCALTSAQSPPKAGLRLYASCPSKSCQLSCSFISILQIFELAYIYREHQTPRKHYDGERYCQPISLGDILKGHRHPPTGSKQSSQNPSCTPCLSLKLIALRAISRLRPPLR